MPEQQPENVRIPPPLSLDLLEDHSLSLFLWNGPGGGALWDDATNWSGGSIPQSGDVAVFQRQGEKAPEAGGDAVQETDGSQ
jgi:hypothetical protein